MNSKPSTAVLAEAVEAVAQSRWDRGWSDDQGTLCWSDAKRLGIARAGHAHASTAYTHAADCLALLSEEEE